MHDITFLFKRDLDKYMVPTLSEEEMLYVLACWKKVFKPVCRYIHTAVNMDFELMSTIAYADVVNQSNLKEVVAFLSTNQNQYPDGELLFLILRSMVLMTWKLDVLYFTHLEQCAQANFAWDQMLILLSRNQLEGVHFSLRGLPYWLRNTSLNYAGCLPDEYQKQYMQMEVVMVKANDIQAKCRRIGQTYIVTLDCGIYFYLQEWYRILLQGYRLKQYCTKYGCSITDPVKTGATLMLSIAGTLKGSGSVYQLPPSAMIFKPNDIHISREIVECQIGFMLGHELGHVIKHSLQNLPYDKSIEYEADDFSMDMLRYNKSFCRTLNKSDQSIQLPEEENNIQSKDLYTRQIEAIEILFAFFDLFYYVCQRKGYQDFVYTVHPEPKERRKNIRQRYVGDSENPLIEYADNLIGRIKKQIDYVIDSQEGREMDEHIL